MFRFILSSQICTRTLLVGLWVLWAVGACTTPHRQTEGTCGNGQLELTEECDQDRFWGQTCEAFGFQGGFLSCSPFCTVDISTCHGYLPTCGNGQVEDLEQCEPSDLNGVTCESWGFLGGTLRCTVACTFDTSGCTGTCADSCILNSRRCAGDWVEVCVAKAGACNEWSPERNCAEEGQSCVPLTFGTVKCETVCHDPCDEGDQKCSDDFSGKLVCEPAGEGDCAQWVEQACGEGRICVVGREITCEDFCSNPCSSGEEGAWRCSADGGSIEECRTVSDYCVRWVPDTHCGAEMICLPWLLSCEPAGTLDTCAQARWAPQLPFVFSGADFTADFTDDATTLDAAPGCAQGTTGTEAFWKARLTAQQTVVVTATQGPGLRFRVHAECDSLACLAAGAKLIFTAPADGEYLFSAEGWGTGTGAYEIRMEEAVLLTMGATCLPASPTHVCPPRAWCGTDVDSSTGYSCRESDGGDRCEDAKPAGLGVFSGELQGQADDDTFAGIAGTVEQWWSFTATADATVVIEVSSAAFATNLLAFSDCTAVPDLWMAAQSGAGGAQVRLPLTTGQGVRLAVEKITNLSSPTLSYAYDLRIFVASAHETGWCTDGMDNDEDGATDCGDADCAGLDVACLVERFCVDGLDDDADGAVDCEDADCLPLEVCWPKAAVYTQLGDGAPAGFQGRRLRFVPRAGAPRAYDWFLEEPAAFFITPGSVGTRMDVVDDALYPLTLPMRFPFFGRSYERVWVSSNGHLLFSEPAGAQPYESPALLVSQPTIALMWDDLSRIQFGDVFNADWGYDSITGRVFWAFTFNCREYTSPSNVLWAQLVLFDDGEIRMDYLTCGIRDAIVGIADPGLGELPAGVSFLP